jgi:hypothetical protein
MMTIAQLAARRSWGLVVVAGLALGACGGGSSPFGNPSLVSNPPGVSGQKLAFAYFERCIYPIFLAQLQINSSNTCASAGCHNNVTGTGGALRIDPAAQFVKVKDPANTPEVIRASAMYVNFYSAQGSTLISSPSESRLLTKPQVKGVLHGGGLIFDNPQDPNLKLIEYWISHPAPLGQDEFSTATYNMFTPAEPPADPNAGTCNI